MDRVMDGWTIFFVIALVAALFTTLVVVIKKNSKSSGKGAGPTAASPRPPERVGGFSKTIMTGQEATPPVNVTVIYEGLRSGAVKRCRFCGCEYALSAMICEICGERL